MSNANQIIVVVKGVIFYKGKVLIVKRSLNDRVGGGTWECVGGKLDFGEDLEDALKREIQEEVGIDVTVERVLFASTFHTEPTRQVVVITYLCQTQNEKIVLSEEHSDFLWATKQQLRTLLPSNIISDFEKHHLFSIKELM
ncbi:NUDIX domain-containing protein [Cytobacillus sp. Hz8]|uniref:NUDIX hydrolase n=1 Tax=Cytobacillus sp. Hz8 TaxID=3347168 RepID=UPI0035DA8ECD